MADNDSLREERDRLLDENAQMRVNGGSVAAGDKVDDGASSTVRYLRSKVSDDFFLEFLCFLSFIVIRSTISRKQWSGLRRSALS